MRFLASKFVTATAGGLLTLGLLGSRSFYASQEPVQIPAPAATVEQPSSWVPMSADIEIIDDDHPEKPIIGKFYRRSDGSTRRETGPANDLTIRVINIKDVSTKRFFTFIPTRGWVSQPMMLPSGGGLPLPRVRETTKGLTDEAEFESGIRVLRYTDRGGVVQRIAPALNLLPLYVKSPNGTTERLHNIVMGEPPEELFAPPPGVAIKIDDNPGGIFLANPDPAKPGVLQPPTRLPGSPPPPK